ncbi:MAG: T9SS type A sorting domain-containing protein [Ignavibacteria bacterium]|nr:T9SS type A sorting domain-containing protein [Ignavibacteria bacterium]
MNAIKFHHKLKQLILISSMLLFLFAYVDDLFAQETKILGKPKNLNTWTPSHLLPKVGDAMATVVRTDFTITMRDGVIIDCLNFIPVDPAPAGGWPTVIMVHGYGDHKETLAEFCRLQAEYGYYTMTYSVRGQGLSGGLSNLISTLEADDLIEIVNWVKADSVHGSAPSKILIMGGSQGGAVPMIAATRGMQVAAIINSVAPPNFASSWMENGCAKMTLLWTIEYTPDTARYNSTVDRMSNWIYADTKPYWDSLAYWMPRDRDYVTGLPNITVPVLIEAAWQDKFFNADGWILNIDKVTSPMSSYLGAVRGHGSDVSLTEDVWHMNWFNNWFFQWLWGMNTTILDEAKYQYASTKFPVVDNQYFTFAHDSSKTLLRTISTPMKLYLNKNGVLKTTVQSGSNNVVLRNRITNGYTLQQAVNDEFTGSNFNSKFKKDSVNFLSSALTSNLEWTGTPIVRLDYKSAAQTFCQFNYQIYEVLPDGTRRFINRANFTDRNYSKGSRRQVTFRGQSHSHVFAAGSKILVIITNLDKAHTDAVFFGTNPFVLPTMKNGDHTVYLSSNSYVELPIVNNTDVSLLFNEEGKDNEIGVAERFNLSQNFPNPFNPSTMIQYTIADAQQVELRVYDMLGREVQTLVNNVQSAGSYNVMFNAGNLASGVYFYKLVAGNFTDIKRMMLIK